MYEYQSLRTKEEFLIQSASVPRSTWLKLSTHIDVTQHLWLGRITGQCMIAFWPTRLHCIYTHSRIRMAAASSTSSGSNDFQGLWATFRRSMSSSIKKAPYTKSSPGVSSPKEPLLLGSKDGQFVGSLDVGTSYVASFRYITPCLMSLPRSIRFIIFDQHAKVIAEHQSEYKQYHPQPGYAKGLCLSSSNHSKRVRIGGMNKTAWKWLTCLKNVYLERVIS